MNAILKRFGVSDFEFLYCLVFRISDFAFVSDFEFRASDFSFTPPSAEIIR